MGRKGSPLIAFLTDALFNDKYVNLRFVGNSRNLFSLDLPKKSCVDKEYQQILKDWKHLKGGTYRFTEDDYEEAKRGMEANLRQSEFLERLRPAVKNNNICRILDPEEVKEKKLLNKTKKMSRNYSFENSDQPPSSVESSGYGSGVDSSVYSANDEDNSDLVATHAIKHEAVESNHALLYALEHDHEYVITASHSNSSEQMELDYPGNIQSRDGATSIIDGLTDYQLEENNKPYLDVENTYLVNNRVSFNDCHLAGDAANCNLEKVTNLEYNLHVENSSTDALSELFGIDEFLTPSLDSPEVKELIESLSEDLLNLENSLMPAIGPHSQNVPIDKVYVCSNREDLNGVIQLTFEPKMIELSFSDHQNDRSTNIKEPSSLKFIWDKSTMKVLSSYIIEDTKLLKNDCILVILKCKEPIINDLL